MRGYTACAKAICISARHFLQRAEEAYRAVASHSSTSMINLGWVLRQEGDEVGTADAFRRAFRESHRVGNGPDIPYATLGVACHASDTGEWRRSALLHGFADAFLASRGEPWQDPEDTYRRQSLDKARAHLGDVDFEEAYGRGTRLDLRSAVDLAVNQA